MRAKTIVRKPAMHHQLIFMSIKMISGFALFLAIYFTWIVTLPADGFDNTVRLFVILIAVNLLTDLSSYLIAATFYRRGRAFKKGAAAWIQRGWIYLISSALFCAGFLWLLADAWGNSPGAVVAAWIVLKMLTYLLAFWLSRIMI